MTLDELRKQLEQSGIPFAYHHWEQKQHPPFGVYFVPYTRSIGADNRVAVQVLHVQVELYTTKKDTALEKRLEEQLDAAYLFYEKEEAYLSSERLYQIIYEIEVSA